MIRLEQEVVLHGGHVVEQQHGAAAPAEELLQRQNLAPVAQRRAREQPQLGQRIEDHTRGLDLVDIGQDRQRLLRQLHLGRMEDRVLLLRLQRILGRQQLAHVDAGQVPTVSLRHAAELLGRFRQRDVEHLLAARDTGEQELHGERRLAGARLPFEQVQTAADQAAAQHVVETGHACRVQRRAGPAVELVFHEPPRPLGSNSL